MIESSFTKSARENKTNVELNNMVNDLESENKILKSERDYFKKQFENERKITDNCMEEIYNYKGSLLKLHHEFNQSIVKTDELER